MKTDKRIPLFELITAGVAVIVTVKQAESTGSQAILVLAIMAAALVLGILGSSAILSNDWRPHYTVDRKMEVDIRTICVISWVAWAVVLVRIFG